MRAEFIRTGNVSRYLAAIAALKTRGAAEACLVVVDGTPGLGKTEVAQWWATQNGALYLRAKVGWRPTWILRDLLAELQVPPARSHETMFNQALAALPAAAEKAANEGGEFGVVIDEVDHIVGDRKALELLRDLSDFLELPFILVGMDRVRGRLARFPQIASRVAQPVEFLPASADDVAALVAGLCEVPVADCLIRHLHAASKGRVREVKEAIAAIERFGRRNPGTVTLAAMDGQPLMTDRATGKPILVRA